MFNGPTIDWNINQVALAYWSSFYDNIYEHPERPDERIINNDDLLDRWVEMKTEEIEEKAKKNGRDIKKSSFSAYDHDEVIYFDDEEWDDTMDDLEYQRQLDELNNE